jgi:hypothetical protein
VLLTDDVDEIGVGGIESSGTHVSGDLSAMVNRVHDDMLQNIFHRAGPAFSQAVFVSHCIQQAGSICLPEMFLPDRGQISNLLIALVQRKFGPDGERLFLSHNALPPQSLRGKNVREKFH